MPPPPSLKTMKRKEACIQAEDIQKKGQGLGQHGDCNCDCGTVILGVVGKEGLVG